MHDTIHAFAQPGTGIRVQYIDFIVIRGAHFVAGCRQMWRKSSTEEA